MTIYQSYFCAKCHALESVELPYAGAQTDHLCPACKTKILNDAVIDLTARSYWQRFFPIEYGRAAKPAAPKATLPQTFWDEYMAMLGLCSIAVAAYLLWRIFTA